MSSDTTVQQINGWTVIAVGGELDSMSGPALSQTVTDQIAAHDALVIDLTGVAFIDSSGLGVLVRALKQTREAHGQLTLVINSEQTLKLFHITALDQTFVIAASREAATESAPSAAAS
jgi:anti-sigma B factor antagonist